MKLFSLRTILLALLLIALPVFVWAVATQRIELRKRAATSEPPVVCWNRVGGNDPYYWPNGCKGNPEPQMCTQATVQLAPSEVYGYKQWLDSGKQAVPGCGPVPTVIPSCNDMSCQNVQVGSNWMITNCNSSDPDGDQQICDKDYKLGLCGGKNYCCLKAGGQWTTNFSTDFSGCPTPTPTVSPTRTPTPTVSLSTLFTVSIGGLPTAIAPTAPYIMPIIKLNTSRGAGTPDMGFTFYVDVYSQETGIPVTSSLAPKYNPQFSGWTVEIPVPTKIGIYRISTRVICSVTGSMCDQTYGLGKQVTKEMYFGSGEIESPSVRCYGEDGSPCSNNNQQQGFCMYGACLVPPSKCQCRNLSVCPNNDAKYCSDNVTQTPAPTCTPRPYCPPGAPCPVYDLPPGGWLCPATTPSPTPGQNCYYKTVQCIQAPCPPILVCPTGSATPSPTCIPRPACMDPLPGQPQCMPDLPPGGWICPKPSIATRPGDLNKDGVVNLFDYNMLLGKYGQSGSPGFTPADINGDGKVNLLDYNILLQNFK